MAQPIASVPEPPPEPRRRGAFATTAAVLALWLVATAGARPLLPLVRDVAGRVEVALGLDVMQAEVDE